MYEERRPAGATCIDLTTGASHPIRRLVRPWVRPCPTPTHREPFTIPLWTSRQPPCSDLSTPPSPFLLSSFSFRLSYRYRYHLPTYLPFSFLSSYDNHNYPLYRQNGRDLRFAMLLTRACVSYRVRPIFRRKLNELGPLDALCFG